MRGSILSVPVQRFGRPDSAVPREDQDLLAVEEPLQIRIGDRNIAITMRTPGHDAELAAGFLFTEGIVHTAAEIERIECGDNIATVALAPQVELDAARLERNFYMTSSCGVCGKASIEALESAGFTILPREVPVVSESVIRSLPDKLRGDQTVFDRTGGLHAAGLFSAEGNLIALREDVGRHNAVDKLVGRALLDGVLPLAESVLLVSGRLSFEIVLKALAAGIPLIAAVSAPSSLAVDLAESGGVTLAAFLRGASVNVYTHPWRIHAG